MKIYKQTEGKLFDPETETWIITTFSNVYYDSILQQVAEGKAKIVPLEPTPMTWNEIRQKRNELLSETDWLVASDVKKTDKVKKWLTSYRQELRDITKNFKTPEEVIWPSKLE